MGSRGSRWLLYIFIFAGSVSMGQSFWFWNSENTTAAPTVRAQYGECSWHNPAVDVSLIRLPQGHTLVPDALHAAHRDLPIGSYAVVKNLKTGGTVRVQITERGPSVTGRIADLSRKAFALVEDLDAKVFECTITPAA